VWLECGGEIGKYDYEVWKKFVAEVGWYKPNKNGHCQLFDYDDSNALPAGFPRRLATSDWFDGGDGGVYITLLSRRDL
jgi:hypothetical protein